MTAIHVTYARALGERYCLTRRLPMVMAHGALHERQDLRAPLPRGKLIERDTIASRDRGFDEGAAVAAAFASLEPAAVMAHRRHLSDSEAQRQRATSAEAN